MGKIIIFGGCGFLGSWIVRVFLKKGYRVSVFDLEIKKDNKTIFLSNFKKRTDFKVYDESGCGNHLLKFQEDWY